MTVATIKVCMTEITFWETSTSWLLSAQVTNSSLSLPYLVPVIISVEQRMNT